MQLPDDQEAERCLLATVCQEGYEYLAIEASQALKESDFLNPKHRIVFNAMCKLLSNSVPINAISIRDAIGANVGKVGGFDGIVEILMCDLWGRVGPLIEIIRKNKTRRDLIFLAQGIAKEAHSDDCVPSELILKSINDLANFATVNKRTDLQLFGDISVTVEAERNEPRHKPVPTGLGRLDRLMGGGFRAGELNILAARPGVGKTSLALEWAVNISSKQGIPVAIFSLEMGKDEVWNRCLSIYSGVPVSCIESDTLEYDQRQSVNISKIELNQSNLMICDNTSLTPQSIGLMIDKSRSRMERDFGIIIIDYLQLLDSDEERTQNETIRIGKITRSLKKKARDWGSSVILLSQLNREIEKREDATPRLSDLRDSGSIEQDSDKVMFISRKMKPVSENEEPDKTAQLLLSKQRRGPTGIVNLYWDGDTTTYREIDSREATYGPPQDRFACDCR